MNKKRIRLTESDLHRIVKESVEKVLKEGKVVNNKPYFLSREHFNERPDDNIVSEAVTKSIRKVLREGIYDYPDGIDHIILLSENDRELYKWYEQMYNMLLKKALKGTELSVDILANSSMMKKYQQACFRKYKSEQAAEGMMNPDAPYQFRKYVSEKLITDVHYDAESRMGNRDKEDMFGAENV